MSTGQSIEQAIHKSALIALGLILLLSLSLLGVQIGLGSQINDLEEKAVSPEVAVASLEKAVSSLRARQVEVVTAPSTEALAEFKARSSQEQVLQDALVHLKEVKPQYSAKLAAQTSAFLKADQELYDTSWARKDIEEKFDVQRDLVDESLRGIVESATGIAGVARLDTILLLRRLRDNAGNPVISREVVFGNGRIQQEAAGEVVKEVLRLGALSGKVGLAPHGDALNGIVANQLPQNIESTRKALEALRRTTVDNPALTARVASLEAEWESAVRSIAEIESDRSLVAMRSAAFKQRAASNKSRLVGAQTGAQLSATLEEIETDVNTSIDSISRSTSFVVWSSGLGTLALLLLGGFGLWTGREHIAKSVSALRMQNNELVELRDSLKEINANLEGEVRERTADLAAREASMRLILDSTGDGLAMVDLQGRFIGERSRAMELWFGSADNDATLPGYLFPEHEVRAFDTQMGLEQFEAGFLPLDMLEAQMPQQIERGGRTLGLTWRAIHEEEEVVSLLLIVSDDTAEIEAEHAARAAAEFQTALRHILKDRAGFLTFIRDGEALLRKIQPGSERATVLRSLHTLKGNSAVMGFGKVARHAHSLEDDLASGESENVIREEAEALQGAWAASCKTVADFIGKQGSLEITESDVGGLLSAIDTTKPYEELNQLVRSWWNTPTAAYLERLAEQSHALGHRLGRSLKVHVKADDFRPPDEVSPFFSSLVHVLRNSIDHGIESEAHRTGVGKPSAGQISLTSALDKSGTLWVELRDDGGGIDWAKLEQKAKEKGVPYDEPTDLLFKDGMSTRDEVTEISGRGVGMAAVWEETERLGGAVTVESTMGKGTSFRFSFPGMGSARAANTNSSETPVTLRKTSMRAGPMSG